MLLSTLMYSTLKKSIILFEFYQMYKIPIFLLDMMIIIVLCSIIIEN